METDRLALTVLESVYNRNAIYLQTATYREGSLNCRFSWFCPDCYLKSPSHLTRVQIVTYLGQAAYVLAGFLARDSELPLTFDGYLERLRQDRATFRRLSLSFRHFIGPSEHVDLAIRSARRQDGRLCVRSARGVIVSPLLFELAGGACQGEAEAVIF